jgi:hypothetical protein
VSEKPASPPDRSSPVLPAGVELTDHGAADLLALAITGAGEEAGSTDPGPPGIPGYTVVGWIGNGGMGAVYRAVQDRLGREVALKIISPVLAGDPAFAVRFEREARTLARLSHPHIVTVHDAGTTADGRMFLAMEWIEGTDLARRLEEQGPLPPAEGLRIARQLCEALHAAHEVGVIHRDVKPSNLLLAADGRVKLADFGIALPVGTSTLTLTLTGTSLGTPDFLPPEAFLPGFVPDARSDVFAGGVTLYLALSGRIPRGRFPALSTIVRGLDLRVDAIIDTALAHDPARRFPSARAMGEAIAAVEALPAGRGRGRLVGFALLALAAVLVVPRLLVAKKEPADPPPAAMESTAVEQPPGVWMPAYHTARAVRTLSPGVRWDRGWIHPDPAAGEALCLYPPPAAIGANWGARAVYRWPAAREARATVTLRKRYHHGDGRELSEHYLFEVYAHEAGFFRNRQSPDGQNLAIPIGDTLPLDLREGREVLVEAFVIDGILYGRVDGQVLETPTDGVLSHGSFDLATYGMPFRDLAFIRLDGLTKDQALKAAGLR